MMSTSQSPLGPTSPLLPSASPPTATATTIPIPPSTFDILPQLHALLSRLLPDSTLDPSAPPLDPQNIASEASALKLRLQKAQAAVEALPDMDRSVEEQAGQIRELEERIRRQREVLAGIKARAREGLRT